MDNLRVVKEFAPVKIARVCLAFILKHQAEVAFVVFRWTSPSCVIAGQ